MAGHLHRSNVLSERGVRHGRTARESKDSQPNLPAPSWRSHRDDGIVVVVFVYLLRCADGSLYVGHTTDLAARERVHKKGRGARFTAERRPVAMVYAEEWPLIATALRRERQLKRWTAGKKEALLSGDRASLKYLSRCRGEHGATANR